MILKGYCSVRLPVPVAVQNLVLRDYCARSGNDYSLADVEFVMLGSYLMLAGVRESDAEGVVAYSLFMAPRGEWARFDVPVHFALEGYVWPQDRELCEIAWTLK